MLSLPPNDPRLRMMALFTWEAQNALHRLVTVLSTLRSFLVSASARDKLGRFFQYLCKLVKEVLVIIDVRKGAHGHDARKALMRRLGKITFDLSNARRTFRVAEVSPLLTLIRLPSILADELFWRSRLVSSVMIAGFNLCERARWCQEHGLLVGSGQLSALRAARLLCVAHVAFGVRTLLRAANTAEAARLVDASRTWLKTTFASADAAEHARQLEAARARARRDAFNGHGELAIEQDAEEFRELLRDALKSCLNFWQCGDIGQVPGLSMPPIMVGIVGTYVSASDLASMWSAR